MFGQPAGQQGAGGGRLVISDLPRLTFFFCLVLAKLEVTSGIWKLKGIRREGLGKKAKWKGTSGLWSYGACITQILFPADAASSGLGRASQTANERFLLPGAATSLPREMGNLVAPGWPLPAVAGSSEARAQARVLQGQVLAPPESCPLWHALNPGPLPLPPPLSFLRTFVPVSLLPKTGEVEWLYWGESVCVVGSCPGPGAGRLCLFLCWCPQSISAPRNLFMGSQVLYRLLGQRGEEWS